MKTKIIQLIKKFRTESKRLWLPTNARTYENGYARGYSVAKGHDADELEELIEEKNL